MTGADPGFYWRGAAGPGGAVLVIEGVSNLLRGCRHGQKDAFSCKKFVSAGERGAISATLWTKGDVVDEKSEFSY